MGQSISIHHPDTAYTTGPVFPTMAPSRERRRNISIKWTGLIRHLHLVVKVIGESAMRYTSEIEWPMGGELGE